MEFPTPRPVVAPSGSPSTPAPPVPRARGGFLSRGFRRRVAEYGGGPYGVGAFGWFVTLEALDVYEWWLRSRPLGPVLDSVASGRWGFDLLFGEVWDTIFSLGIESIMNGVWAMMWPIEVIERFGTPGIVLVGALLSVEAFRYADDDEEEDEDEDGGGHPDGQEDGARPGV